MYRAPPAPAPLAIVATGYHVIGMERRTGQRVWQWSSNGTSWTRIAIDAERVVVGGGHELASLAYDTGALIWRVKCPLLVSTLLVDGDVVLVGSQGTVICFASSDGSFLWHDGLKGFGIGAVALGFPGNAAQIDLTG